MKGVRYADVVHESFEITVYRYDDPHPFQTLLATPFPNVPAVSARVQPPLAPPYPTGLATPTVRDSIDLRNNRGNCENRMGSGARGSAASTIFSPASLIIPNVVQSLSRMEACLKWKSAWNRSAPRMEVCTEWQARI